MKTIKLLSINLFLLFHFCQSTKTTKKNKTVKNIPKQETFFVENELENKTFYFLEQNEKNGYILRKYPQYSEDFEMPKYRFKKNIFIDGSNVMVSSEWDILKILKKDTVLEYVLNMRQNKDIYDTFIIRKTKCTKIQNEMCIF